MGTLAIMSLLGALFSGVISADTRDLTGSSFAAGAAFTFGIYGFAFALSWWVS